MVALIFAPINGFLNATCGFVIRFQRVSSNIG